MNKIIIALGIALASSTAALAQSSALDVVGHATTYTQPAIDNAATASIGAADFGVEAVQNRANLGDGSPMVSAAPVSNVAIETYSPVQQLGGNS